MGRAPCCDKANVKKGPWSPEEDAKLKDYIAKHGTGGNWIAFPQKAGLKRCGKSCRLRWLNYLRPNIRHGEFSDDEDRIICTLYSNIGSRWSIIAGQLPGRTDNDIKNYWNTKLKKKILMGSSCQMRKPIQPNNFQPLLHASSSLPSSPLSTDPLSYTALARSFTDPILFSSTPNLSINSSASASSTNLYNQESFLDPTLHQFQGKEQNLIVFGGGSGDQTSNFSSNSDEQIAFQSNCLYNGLVEQKQKQKMVISDGLWGEINPLDYGLEEIKQLISSTTTLSKKKKSSTTTVTAATTSFCNNFTCDEIKTEEKVMYY